MTQSQILFWNRRKSKEEVEQVYGDAMVRWLYGTKLGQNVADRFLTKNYLSRIYGVYQSSPLSRHQIAPFIKKFQIPMGEFQSGPYRTFNEFFIRKFKTGTRPFVSNPNEFPAFAEARYYAYGKVETDQKFPVKGSSLSIDALLGNAKKASPFIGGPLLLARLCPTDYHRFHFPDDGEVLESYVLHGKLHSVNPMALQYRDDIFTTNERQVSILDTKNFGKLAYIEVGALCVGKIVQTYQCGPKGRDNDLPQFKRGDEKGYFLFGASTVIVAGEPGRWVPDQDLLEQTCQGRETLVQLGDRVAGSSKDS